MMTHVRAETAEILCRAILHKFPLAKFNEAKLTPEFVATALEIPKKLEHGHLALPVFPLAKELRQAPPLIAQQLAQVLSEKLTELEVGSRIAAVTPVGGFLNVTFQDDYLQKILMQFVAADESMIGRSVVGRGKRLVIDYSSPNVAKPMHVGHLRATVIGQAIRNLAETQGYTVIGLNHLGDWGVQFGKLAWAYMQWGGEYDFENKPFESLFEIYVRFHDAADKDPGLEAEGSLVFKKLENGDPEITALWRKFVDISMKEYGRIWGLMGVQHDLVRGESFYNDRMKNVEDLLENKGLLEKSEGASVVRVGDDMPPCLIRKSDGASLYATRDLASALYRHDELKADLNLYVVGVDQTLHFKQVFKVLELMGYDWAQSCHHISFGMYRFKEGKMSTRKGRAIFLEDVLSQAIELVEKLIEEKNPDLENKKVVAQQVGLGAVVFNDLAVDRVRDVEFDWEKVLNFEGDSGPYVQYTHVRCVSLIRKSGRPAPTLMNTVLASSEERELVRILLNYQDVLSASFANFRPNILAQYLLEVCAAFSRFYNKHRILGEPQEIEQSRLALVEATRKILKSGLGVLNIQAPQAM
jgi:arginyl-tRNA synthetase